MWGLGVTWGLYGDITGVLTQPSIQATAKELLGPWNCILNKVAHQARTTAYVYIPEQPSLWTSGASEGTFKNLQQPFYKFRQHQQDLATCKKQGTHKVPDKSIEDSS